MTTPETERVALYNRLVDVLGPKPAATLINHLASRDDIVRLQDRIDGIDTRLDRIESRFDSLDDRMHGFYRSMLVTMAGTMTALTAIFTFVVVLVL